MLIGAGLNILLDPLFIFVFEWGVEGAAWATIISQFVSMLWLIHFTTGKKAIVRLKFQFFRPSRTIILQIMAFGSAPALLQLALAGVQFVYNASTGIYGEAALGVANGGDIAIAGMQIIGSLTMLIFMPIFGINQGAQPILGYNYGAKKFPRVRSAYLRAALAATGICLGGFALAQFFPGILVRIFAPEGSPQLLQFTPWAMRIMLITLPLNGFQIVSTNLFAVTGRPKISILFSMLRQVIVLIPSLLIFGKIWGLAGIVSAAPVADGVTFLLTVFMVAREMKELKAGK
jgi:Na+-driven multidrug efflux pump